MVIRPLALKLYVGQYGSLAVFKDSAHLQFSLNGHILHVVTVVIISEFVISAVWSQNKEMVSSSQIFIYISQRYSSGELSLLRFPVLSNKFRYYQLKWHYFFSMIFIGRQLMSQFIGGYPKWIRNGVWHNAKVIGWSHSGKIHIYQWKWISVHIKATIWNRKSGLLWFQLPNVGKKYPWYILNYEKQNPKTSHLHWNKVMSAQFYSH